MPASLLPSSLGGVSSQELRRRLEPITIPSSSPKATFTNWGLSFTCQPSVVFEPETDEQCEWICELARREGRTVRAAGMGHSPSDLACTSEFMLRTNKLDKIVEVNVDKRYIVAQGGVILNTVHATLAEHNLAMINLGSISDQTLAGVVTTATHGTGFSKPVISKHVLSLVLLLADGSRVRCSEEEHRDLFLASLCGLGSTGIILYIKLEVCPAFRLREIQKTIPFDNVVGDLDRISRSAEHAKKTASSWMWHSALGYHLIQFLFFLGLYLPALNPWICRLTAWLDRHEVETVDDSHKVFNLDCKYPQYTTEWAIPYKNTKACLYELRSWLDREHQDPRGLRPHYPIEIRFSDADDIWLSPSNGQITCWIGIIQYRPYGLPVPYRKLFNRFEDILARHGGRPHWAKAHGLRPDDLRRLYPKFDDFVQLLKEVDPRGLYRNAYVQRHIFGKEGPEHHERVFKERP